jgi:hypothetical protein
VVVCGVVCDECSMWGGWCVFVVCDVWGVVCSEGVECVDWMVCWCGV